MQGEIRAQHEVRFCGIDVGDLVSGAGGHIYILAGNAAQLVCVLSGNALVFLIFTAPGGVVQKLGAERVFFCFAVLNKQSLELQALDNSMNGADGHADQRRNIRYAELLNVIGKAVQNVKRL